MLLWCVVSGYACGLWLPTTSLNASERIAEGHITKHVKPQVNKPLGHIRFSTRISHFLELLNNHINVSLHSRLLVGQTLG